MSVGKKITEISAGDRATELQQLLEITSELGTLGDLDEFLQKFVVRAADFLAFQRAAIAIADHGTCALRWIAQDGFAKPLRLTLPYPMTQRLLAGPEPVAVDDVSKFPELDQETARQLDARQFLSIPMLTSHREPLGLLLMFDRDDAGSISAEDIRKAKALAAEVAVVLEATQNLHNAKENRERAENLMSLALELNSSLRLPQFVRSFTQRAADMLGARAAMLALAQRSVLETVIVHDPESVPDKGLLRRLNSALTEFCSNHTEAITTGTAETFLGAPVAARTVVERSDHRPAAQRRWRTHRRSLPDRSARTAT